ncbi:hypothetical protein FQR65_LT15047 [Abscondita terminalis]|nr:hypothetical protein FQR65_LT15047 [Abscondita terminalis]
MLRSGLLEIFRTEYAGSCVSPEEGSVSSERSQHLVRENVLPPGRSTPDGFNVPGKTAFGYPPITLGV